MTITVKLKADSDGTFSVLSKEAPPVSTTATTYDATNGTVTIPAVEADGKVEYANVKLGFNSDGTLSVLSTEAPPVSDSLSCSTYVPGTSYCNDGKYPSCIPDLSQAAQVQKGMTYDQVVKIIGCHGVFDSMSSAGVDFYWSDGQYGTPFTSATFRDGKLDYFSYSPS
ncbi:hypothetical protein [Methylobacter luteus]|uniref:hypothetical protein n=1 Tax=Methylobacter luteus TaxID=415 RepID=UPI0012DF0FBD|nr:hypothetical protein [Methylobacter luteus]